MSAGLPSPGLTDVLLLSPSQSPDAASQVAAAVASVRAAVVEVPAAGTWAAVGDELIGLARVHLAQVEGTVAGALKYCQARVRRWWVQPRIPDDVSGGLSESGSEDNLRFPDEADDQSDDQCGNFFCRRPLR